MEKVINPVIKRPFRGRAYRVYIKIKFRDGKLSISGVEGPLKSGNCLGSCGQILDELRDDVDRYLPDWDAQKLDRLVQIWRKWHLNDLHAECIHQEERGENWGNNPSAVCPECGWKLGHGWCSREVPKEVIDWLFSLPDAKVEPAWV